MIKKLLLSCVFILAPSAVSGQQYYYKCKYPATWIEYSIDQNSGMVKVYSIKNSSVNSYPLDYHSPAKYVWTKTIKLGPYPNYNNPSKMVNEKHEYNYEFNRKDLTLLVSQRSCDYANGNCWDSNRTYKCYENR
jgi:hypothetical protein